MAEAVPARPPSLAPTPRAPASAQLSGNLGVFSITLMVVATAAPLAVIGGTAPLATAFGNGIGAASDFLVVSVCLLLFAVSLGAMSPFVGNAGAFYAYIGHGLGSGAGMAGAALSWMTYTSLQIASYAYFGVLAAGLVVEFGGPELDWWWFALGALGVVALLGYRRIDLTAKVLSVALGLEVAVVLLVDIGVAIQGGAQGLDLDAFVPQNVIGNFPGFAVGVMFCAAGFIGFEATAVFRDEAKDPDRTVPRATYAAIAFIGIFYCVSTWLVSLAWPRADLLTEATTGLPFLLGPADEFTFTAVSDIISVLIVSSMFACVLSLHNIIARYQYILGRSEVLPSALGRTHPRHHSPHVSSIAQSTTMLVILVVTVYIGMDPYAQILAWFAGLASAAFLVLLTLTCLSCAIFFAKRPGGSGVWRTRVVPVLGTVSLGGLVVITVINYDYLVPGTVGYVLLATLPLAALTAFAATAWLKHHHPHRFASVAALTLHRETAAPLATHENSPANHNHNH